MKGTIVKCLQDLVTNNFGKDKWEKSLEDAGLSKSSIFLPVADVEDSQVMKVVGSVCKTLNISLQQAAEAFGDYWVNVYSQKLYKQYYQKSKSSKEFLLELDNVHVIMTRSMENAKPPRFVYEWKDGKTLIMNYKSQRGLIDFMVGLVKGVGKFYKENLSVTKISSNKVQIVFP